MLRLEHREITQLDRTWRIDATSGTDADAAASAITQLARRGAMHLREPVAPGVLALPEVRAAFDQGMAERAAVADQSWAEQRDEPSRIIEVARELGLAPQPTGGSVGSWQARCPRRPHTLMLSPRSGQFGCGYCRVKGGPDDLAALVHDRRGR